MVSQMTHLSYVELISFNITLFHEDTAEKNKPPCICRIFGCFEYPESWRVMSHTSHNESYELQVTMSHGMSHTSYDVSMLPC